MRLRRHRTLGEGEAYGEDHPLSLSAVINMSDHISTVPFEERSFSVKTACEILSISKSVYFELISAGAIETYKQVRSRKITGRAINLYRTKLRVATEQGSSS
ncbi:MULTISPECIES: hypothetical protein [Bradyrhizobium]|uniref:hypothetical protein n=1 Tax=Bradyrhizobium elkanii TaxID=29448 RepID=UPI0012BC02A2|nr:hypothetical protein [Bradyrhizobium elkanii]